MFKRFAGPVSEGKWSNIDDAPNKEESAVNAAKEKKEEIKSELRALQITKEIFIDMGKDTSDIDRSIEEKYKVLKDLSRIEKLGSMATSGSSHETEESTPPEESVDEASSEEPAEEEPVAETKPYVGRHETKETPEETRPRETDPVLDGFATGSDVEPKAEPAETSGAIDEKPAEETSGEPEEPASGDSGEPAHEEPGESAPEEHSEETGEGEEHSEEAGEGEEEDKSEKRKEKIKKILNKPVVRSAIMVALLMTAIFVGTKAYQNGGLFKKKNNLGPVPGNTAVQSLDEVQGFANVETEEGEQEYGPYEGVYENGVRYNYSKYVEANAKKDSDKLILEHHRFSTDRSYLYDMDESTAQAREEKRQAAIDAAMEVTTDQPEVLALYVETIFNEKEKEEYHVKDISAKQLDGLLSDRNVTSAGEWQNVFLEKLKSILENEDTRIVFRTQDKPQDSYYLNWEDKNNDGKITPDEVELCKQSNIPRNGEKQFDIYRGGQKVAAVNLSCGLQICTEVGQSDQDVPEIGDTPGTTPTPTPGTTPTPTPGTTPTPTPGTTPTPTPEVITPKNPDNLIRIDENINEDIADDIGSGEVNPGYNPGVRDEDLTPAPRIGDYYDYDSNTVFMPSPVEPPIQENNQAPVAEVVQPQNPVNDYSENRGGANANEFSPVQENTAGQERADANEIPISEAPSQGSQEAEDALADLGIF